MPRTTPTELVQQINTLTREGRNQSEVARMLGIQQPRVSKIMRAHGIPLAVDPRFIKGNTKYHTPEGEVITFSVQLSKNGKPDRTLMHASPEQLHEMALVAAQMLHTPCPCPTNISNPQRRADALISGVCGDDGNFRN